ncbi:hypothetical protein, partial [Zooshikella sp. RANM57]|uniref:hypothetical protein n=1 Tax=Zooshikella sp. RANM57 TaxID=3425863 RepID=UPI003D6F3E15
MRPRGQGCQQHNFSWSCIADDIFILTMDLTMYASMIKNKKIIRDYLDKLADIDNTPFVDVTKKSF